jgi:hypothetical protein
MVAVYQQSLKYRRDGFNARMDEFCRLVFEAADYAADYWVSKKLSSTAKESNSEARLKMRIVEARIGGFQQKINLFFEVIRPFLKVSDRDQLTNLLADFFDAMTGGNFGAKARSADEMRAKLVYTNGSELVAHLRSAKPTLSWQSIFVMAFFTFISVVFFAGPLMQLVSKR